METVAIIPARYGSSRFPGKPLAEIAGVSMIRRVWALAKAAPCLDDVVVATDDQRIVDAVLSFGGKAVMTPEDCKNGTERVLKAAEQLGATPQRIINLQGDAVLTPPWIINDLAKAMIDDPEVQICTPAVHMTPAALAQLEAAKKEAPASGTTVVFDRNFQALYFSKRIIPYLREVSEHPPVYRHIGMYGYTLDALKQYVELPQSPLEHAEQLEQLRALENGIPVRVVIVDYNGRTHASVDAPSDKDRAEQTIKEQGELLPTYDGSYRLSE